LSNKRVEATDLALQTGSFKRARVASGFHDPLLALKVLKFERHCESHADMVDRVFQYAERVAGGFRQPLPEVWPPEIRSLIADCWASNPLSRPSAAKVRNETGRNYCNRSSCWSGVPPPHTTWDAFPGRCTVCTACSWTAVSGK